jgi:hypothetical protein
VVWGGGGVEARVGARERRGVVCWERVVVPFRLDLARAGVCRLARGLGEEGAMEGVFLVDGGAVVLVDLGVPWGRGGGLKVEGCCGVRGASAVAPAALVVVVVAVIVADVVGGDFGRKRERERELTTESGRRASFVAGVLVVNCDAVPCAGVL